MIRFSNKIKYGLQFLLFIDVDNEALTDIQRAAISCNIPHKFLESIAVDLKKNGILEVKRGAGGGYKLAKHPKEISLADVVRSLEKNEIIPYKNNGELTRQVVEETLDKTINDFWESMETQSLHEIQKNYYENADKIMYYI
jgi:Rrf2 family transcriptional regulator, cysteine metabolism repressor